MNARASQLWQRFNDPLKEFKRSHAEVLFTIIREQQSQIEQLEAPVKEVMSQSEDFDGVNTIAYIRALHKKMEGQRKHIAALTAKLETSPPATGPLKLDTDRQVFFYEQDHYYLSNFSAFCVHWHGRSFLTSEHAYHWARFDLPEGRGVLLQDCVWRTFSAHEAFRFAQENKSKQREDWDTVKVDTMRDILDAKAEQHEYVRRKLLETGDRELIENSWRDDFWGWGPNRDGQNMLGKLWMDIRAELRGPQS